MMDKLIDKLMEYAGSKNHWDFDGGDIDMMVGMVHLVKAYTEGHVLVPIDFLKAAECPDPDCDDGLIPHQVAEDEWDGEQCQFCHEKSAMITAYKGEDQ